MKIATWNVNSLAVRLPQVLDWLLTEQPDMLCLQETKMEDHRFPADAFREAGWHSCCAGQKSYNGVAIVSKKPPQRITVGIDSFDDPQKRLIGAQFDGLWVFSVYAPNGESLTSDKYLYKLDWFARFLDFLKKRHGNRSSLLAGDFNIAPDDRDVYDPAVWKNRVVVSDPEREAFRQLCALGFSDAFRLFEQPENVFSWWDFRTKGFSTNRGLRIDMVMVSDDIKPHCRRCWIDKAPRTAERPSDHTPVIVEIDWPTASDGPPGAP